MSPYIKYIAVGLGGALVSIPIYFSSIIGSGYQNAILTHLEDIIDGGTTTTVVSTNAPNWSLGLPITAPIITSIATSSNGSAASGLASSTSYVFQVAALDGTGTTTLANSSTTTTDASTTQQNPEDIVLQWTPENGATSYAVFFATSTTVASTGLNQYFLATTSAQYTFSTSTGSLSGSYIRNTTTAFSELLNPSGTDIFNDNLNTATSSKAASTTAVQIDGTAVITAQGTTTACESDTAGAIFFNSANGHEWGCTGTPPWTKIF